MTDVLVKVRQAKRANEKELNLAGLSLTDVPIEISKLTSLEVLKLHHHCITLLARPVRRLAKMGVAESLPAGVKKVMRARKMANIGVWPDFGDILPPIVQPRGGEWKK